MWASSRFDSLQLHKRFRALRLPVSDDLTEEVKCLVVLPAEDHPLIGVTYRSRDERAQQTDVNVMMLGCWFLCPAAQVAESHSDLAHRTLMLTLTGVQNALPTWVPPRQTCATTFFSQQLTRNNKHVLRSTSTARHSKAIEPFSSVVSVLRSYLHRKTPQCILVKVGFP